MDNWNEMRSAYKLAKFGTLSATANDIGVHRSTVMRHIDILEEALKVKLFQRNDKGYIPTEAGLEIMRLGEVTENHFDQFVNQAKNKENLMKGILTITCVSELAKGVIPSINKFQNRYPEMQVDIIGDNRKYGLEYGEADLAVRTGEKPTTLDNIVVPFINIELTLCVHKDYIRRFGLPDKNNITSHRFIAQKERLLHFPWNEWIYTTIPQKHIILTSSNQTILNYALLDGCGLGFTTKQTLENNENLIEIDIGKIWTVPTWILIHRDMVNMPKVRQFLDILKQNNDLKLELN